MDSPSVTSIAEQRIIEYKKSKYHNKQWYYTSQGAIIVLSGVTPLLLLINLHPIFPAISSAIASITAGLSSNFKFREKYDIHVNALDGIELELDNFKVGTGIYANQDDEKKKNILMHNMDAIHRNRRSHWSAMITGSPSPESIIAAPEPPDRPPDKPLGQ
jgi:Protein of unknown function (DUF4231)